MFSWLIEYILQRKQGDTVVFHFCSCHKSVNTQGMVVVVRLPTHDVHLSGPGARPVDRYTSHVIFLMRIAPV